MKAEEFDQKFDNGESIIEYLDLTQIKRADSEQQTIAIDIPFWMIEALNQESQRIGIPLQSIIKNWIEERLSNPNWISNSL